METTLARPYDREPDSHERSAMQLALRRSSPELLMWFGGFLLMLCALTLLLRGQMNLLCALLIAIGLIMIAVFDRVAASLVALGFLNLLGDVRRIVSSSFGQPVFDLLLLVGPGLALYLALPLLLRIRLRDNLSKAMFYLLVIMVLEIFNPQQGGLVVGITGAIFYIAPVLWFWVAREYASPAVVEKLLYRVILPIALGAAVLGLCQTFIGFTPWEQIWINEVSKRYIVLQVGGATRAFGFSVSAAEYATLLGIGSVASAAAFIASRRAWGLTFPVLVVALVLASSRSLIFKLILALAVVWLLREGRSLGSLALVRLGMFIAVGLVGVGFIASHFGPSETTSSHGTSGVQSLLAHQAGGLAHPLDQRYSTAGLHSQMVAVGVVQGFADPIGHGLGTTTLAGIRFGGESDIGSSEMDISDMFICLGLLGGSIYAYIVYLSMRKVIVYTQTVPLAISLPVLAILTLTLAGWLIGGQYSTSSVIFFLLGSLAYQENQRRPSARLPGASTHYHLTSRPVVVP